MEELNNKITTCEFCHLGNGISVYTKDFEVNNDYPFIAHISVNRVVTYNKRQSKLPYKLRPNYKEWMSKEVIDSIENYAKNENPVYNTNIPIFNNCK